MAVTLSPNPTADLLHLTLRTDRTRALSFELLDARGTVRQRLPVRTVAAGQRTETLDVTDLSPGTYFLRISDGTAVRSVGFVKR